VLDGMLTDRQGALFPNVGTGDEAAYNSADAPLWFTHAVQQFIKAVPSAKRARLWKKYGPAVLDVIGGLSDGRHGGIGLGEDGLLYAAQPGKALTWMDAVVNGSPVTPRAGAPVEINALWYNALCFAREALKRYGAPDEAAAYGARWEAYIAEYPERFKSAFWSKRHGYLADVVTDLGADFTLRPNQIIAAALPHKPISNKICQLVVERVRQVLLTPRGLRTLAPMDARFEGLYEGDQATRDARYHQGIVWVWLLEPYAKACVGVYGDQARPMLQKIWQGFEPAVSELCMGSLPEIYDGQPPYAPRGAVSQAWSVAALLRINEMLQS
ncbi:MAG: amylo-alpha-1,6-glucosidase, partial [Bacteroidales bacterium]|nr:amylo-alpha-1,6-glucosidase [Bacteroidales bacterium]